MPLRDEGERVWQRAYMKLYRQEQKALGWEKQLSEERRRMRKAVKRVETAERWAAAGEKIDPSLLSLAYHWNQIAKEEKAKAKNKKLKTASAVLKTDRPIEKAVDVRDALAVAVAVRGPLPFESVP